jgi:transcriptional regulator with XRE-family HTH domain
MTKEEISTEFFKAIEERGVAKKLGVTSSRVSHWRNPERVPTIGLMLEVLHELGKIKITLNE